jgi:DNA repair protein RecN (Recombination protein N)
VLRELRVRNLGVIEDLSLELGPGMTVLTGETGAGKTLVVEALQLLLGSRPESGLVRTGTAEALVEARFEPPGGGEVILARAVPATGRSRAWVDGRMAPVGMLSEEARSLIDIHGQHEHQSLRSPAAQRAALDVFASLDLGELGRARAAVRRVTDEIAALGGDARTRAREIDVVRHQLAEIATAAIENLDEEAALVAEEEQLADVEAHREALQTAGTDLRGSDEQAAGSGAGAVGLLAEAAAVLSGRDAFGPWQLRLRTALAEVADVAGDLRALLDELRDDPARLAAVQGRRRELRALRDKYGPSLADVAEFARASSERLAELEAAGERAVALEADLASARLGLAEAEAAVRRARAAAAPGLGDAVGGRLAELAMPGARLEVRVAAEGSGEPVQFLFGANPGEALAPLQRAASGGELARAMLALRLIAAGGPGTMVFDEVDAGVGGSAALALARSLREAAGDRQVLVVTHLAQVAAFADCHVAVQKRVRGERTTTEARVLGPGDRIVEITRMLSGRPDSETGRAHAEELLAFGSHRPTSTRDGGALV